MVEIQCVPVEAWHLEHVAQHMRADDRREVAAMSGRAPIDVLREGVAQPGHAWTALFDGEPAAIFGVIPVSLIGGTACAWLLGTTLLETQWRAFAKASRPAVAELLERYPRLINVTLVDNTLSMRWLAWLGARFVIHGNLARFELCANPPR